MITLVLGGARSGKSEVAERIAARLPAPIKTTISQTRFVPHRFSRRTGIQNVPALRLCLAMLAET